MKRSDKKFMMVNWNVMGKSTNFLFAVLYCARLCLPLCNPWAVVCQAPLSVGFSRQEY